MPSCGFLKHARASASSALLGVLWLARAALAAEPGAQPSPEQQAFLKLPERSIEAVGGEQHRSGVSVGDRLIFRVDGAHDGASGARVTVELPPGATLEDAGWLIDEPEEAELPPLEQRRAGEVYFSAVPLAPGAVTLLSLAIRESGAEPFARTQAVPLQVASSISRDDPKPSEPKGEIAPLGMPFPVWVLMVLSLLVILGLALLLALAIPRIRRYLAERNKKPPPIPLTEDEAALKALLELDKQPFVKRGEYKPYYFGVSEILKQYIGLRYGFDAPESTSDELLTYLEDGKKISDAILDSLESLFERLDRVKFTDFVPEAEEPARLMEQARTLVLQTRRPPVVVVPTAGASGPSRRVGDRK